jgi:multidrug efflux pump subunit AcrA (membrane-fusion protein)
MFVEARVLLGDAGSATLVQSDAVHYFGGKPFVFVQLSDDLYELRRIQVGPRDNGQVPVLQGLADGDLVVQAESYLVKSEFQKSRLGAGCVD